MPLKTAQRVPVATYRVQLHAGFNFAELIKRLPYLRSLGISDVYCSPIFAAAPGSTHGYDVSDYRTINPELGGEEGFYALSNALREHEMGLLLDFVPNHMGINGPFNAWWLDVLECGKNSPYAQFFDIHWNLHQGADRILVPMLEDHYGLVLEKGSLVLKFVDGAFQISYGETRFPIRPESYPTLLTRAAEKLSLDHPSRRELTSMAADFTSLPKPETPEREEQKQHRADSLALLKRRLLDLTNDSSEAASAIAACLAEMNGQVGQPRSFDALDRLLDEQHYRLARWKTGAHETNYRRFFAIDTLVGLRMERDEVFHESHSRLAKLVRDGHVTGLRIDHIDGLWDAERYLDQLQQITRSRENAPPLYVLVEKIVEGQEQLPTRWQAHGTTGYEFAANLGQLFTDPLSESRFDRIYGSFIQDRTSFADTVYASKRLVLDEMFANAVHNLAAQLDMLLSPDRRWRDLTRHELTVALREIIAHLTVYRTYRRFGDTAASPADIAVVKQACTLAKARNEKLDPEPFELIQELLIGNYPPPDTPEDFRAQCLGWVMTFQQYTGAVMAKSVEDTAFYVHNRLIALNEVGGDPTHFGQSADVFHRICATRASVSPLTQLTTSTHDTKLSEDARARLHVLSEMPEEWEDWLREWRELNSRHKTRIGSQEAPDFNEEYRLYQSLLASWPLDDVITDSLRKRLREYLRKSVSEAKRNTTWIHPNEPWLTACDNFVDALLDGGRSSAFLTSFRTVAGRVARLGMINSLTQVALKITTPGVPDFYQGNEIFDFSLVDPDNRRAVDFDYRQTLSESLDQRGWHELLANWQDGAIKQKLTRELLRFRAASPQLFQEGDYTPLPVRGRFAEHLVAFRRQHATGTLVVIVPRLTAKLGCPPLGLIWDDTRVVFEDRDLSWREILTATKHRIGAHVSVAELLRDLPIAVLHYSPSATPATDHPSPA
jgi:(1->4)-alpha-D-glucan 1-alpha-D-glucosylmutase